AGCGVQGRGLPHLRDPRGAGRGAARARPVPVSIAAPAAAPAVDLRLRLRRLRGRRLRPPSGERRAGRRLTVSLVAAVARDGVIGRNGTVPWHLPEDMRFFRDLTTGDPVGMGRGTLDSLP